MAEDYSLWSGYLRNFVLRQFEGRAANATKWGTFQQSGRWTQLMEFQMDERIVAIGLLTRADMTLLGEGFHRHFPVQDDDNFSDLIAKFDEAEARRSGGNIDSDTAG